MTNLYVSFMNCIQKTADTKRERCIQDSRFDILGKNSVLILGTYDKIVSEFQEQYYKQRIREKEKASLGFQI